MWRIVFRIEGDEVLDVDLTGFPLDGDYELEQRQRTVRRLAAAAHVASESYGLSDTSPLLIGKGGEVHGPVLRGADTAIPDAQSIMLPCLSLRETAIARPDGG